ncbi:MAG: hypothetical protein WDM71_04255 [Ferruginibacter sp.]
MDELIKQQPDVMINLSASPFDYTHAEDRKAIIKSNVQKYKLPMFYCNCVGSQTEIVFDGRSFVFDKEGNVIGQLPLFAEALQGFEMDDDGNIDEPMLVAAKFIANEEYIPLQLEENLNIGEVYDAIVMSIKDYFKKMGFTKAIIGSSGGIDSAVTLAMACDALGKENVRAILMPSYFSTEHSVNDAEQLSINLGNKYDIIPIKNIYDSFLHELKPIFNDLPLILRKKIFKAGRGEIY